MTDPIPVSQRARAIADECALALLQVGGINVKPFQEAMFNVITRLEAAAYNDGLEAGAKVADEIGKAYGEDETGWFDCSETVATAIRDLKGRV